jgi:hypothetical protein
MAKWQSSSKGKTYVYLVFFTSPNKTSCEKIIHEGNWIQGHKQKINHSSHTISTSYKSKWFFIIKLQDFPKTFATPRHHFWNALWRQKNHKWMNQIYLVFFLASCHFRLPLQIFFKFLNSLHLHVFSNKLFHVL